MKRLLFPFAIAAAVACAAPQAVRADAPAARLHAIRVHLDPAGHTVTGVDSLRLVAPVRQFDFYLHADLEPSLEDASLRLEPLADDPDHPAEGLRRWRALDTVALRELWVIRMDGRVFQDVSGTVFGREKVGAEIRATVGEEGVYLAAGAGWYPLVDRGDAAEEIMCGHRVTAVLPAGWTSLTQGALIRDFTAGGQRESVWNATNPSDGVTLVANRFRVDSRQHGDTLVETYFFPEDSSLAAGYLDSCEGYLDLYEGFLTPYPFSKFAVVENFFPTGYGMPSWTLLGQQVLRLPFIKATSLGHEIAHNWWGNSVFIGEGGNWCEGLTVYCADYLYKELESAEAARQYRKNTLKDYTRYTRDDRDFPLREFVSRHDAATRAVGYGKSMFVFHMLEERVGRPAFRAALRHVIDEHQWGTATWSDFFRAVEAEGALAPDALEDERAQWIDRAGAAQLALGDVTVTQEDGSAWLLRGELLQAAGEPLILSVPLRVNTAAGPVDFTVQTAAAKLAFERRLDAPPSSLAVDPDYHVFRRLDEEEMEATLSLVMADEHPLFVLQDGLAPELAEACRAFAAAFVEGAPHVVAASAPADTLNAARTLIWLGSSPPPFRDAPEGLQTTPFFTVFQGQRFEPEHHALVYIGKRGTDGGFMAVLADNPSELAAIASKVPHYGKYSYLGFNGGTNVLKGNWDASAGPLLRRLAVAR